MFSNKVREKQINNEVQVGEDWDSGSIRKMCYLRANSEKQLKGRLKRRLVREEANVGGIDEQ